MKLLPVFRIPFLHISCRNEMGNAGFLYPLSLPWGIWLYGDAACNYFVIDFCAKKIVFIVNSY